MSYLPLLLSLLLMALSPAISWAPNFAHLGAWTGSNLEASPLYYRGQLYLMMSQMGEFPPGGAHSFFCVFDGITGEKLSCPASSSGHAFCSAIVQPADDAARPPRNETLWVFCSAWDRANHTECQTPGWGCGACANPEGGCYVGSWSCSADSVDDCGDWQFTHALTLPGKVTVPNVGVGLVPHDMPAVGDLPRHQAFMALESSFSLAVNVGSDGDLSSNWIFLDPNSHTIDGVSNAGLCPFARYNAVDNYYYVGGGGEHINLARSKNLSSGSWAAPPGGPVERGCTELAEDCSAGSPVAKIAPGFWVNYWTNESDHGERAFLQNLTAWDFSVNDADLADNGTHTFFIYGQCAQTAPPGFKGKAGNFYQIGLGDGNATTWLSSFWAP
jgi:hypothetical protein